MGEIAADLVEERERRRVVDALCADSESEAVAQVDVQYSIPYCLGLVALLGPDALLPLEECALGRSDVTAFARASGQAETLLDLIRCPFSGDRQELTTGKDSRH